jgi:hypothetical protein
MINADTIQLFKKGATHTIQLPYGILRTSDDEQYSSRRVTSLFSFLPYSLACTQF